MSFHKIRTGEVGAFFVYDHTVLKREEDDLVDAILYFYPPYVDIEEQCAVCGQLMGMSEFLLQTISKSVPVIFKLQTEKYCLKRVGNYSFVLEGSLQDSDSVLKKQLEHIYSGFVLVCGSVDNIKEQFVDSHVGFLAEMKGIWDILFPSVCPPGSQIDRVFHLLPSVELPKSSADLFLQASNMLQSSQRRPGVIMGAVLYKNKVLCTQMSPELTRKLVLVRPELPCIHIKTDFQLPGGIRLVTVFLTDEEYSVIKPLVQSENRSRDQYRHNQVSKFVWVSSLGESNTKKSDSPKRFTKDDTVHWRPSSRAELTLNQLTVPKQTGRLSDIPIIECEESKSDVSYSEKNEESRKTLDVTVPGEATESISDLDDDDYDEKEQTSTQTFQKKVNLEMSLSKVAKNQNSESNSEHSDTKNKTDSYVVLEKALVHVDSVDILKTDSSGNTVDHTETKEQRSEDLPVVGQHSDNLKILDTTKNVSSSVSDCVKAITENVSQTVGKSSLSTDVSYTKVENTPDDTRHVTLDIGGGELLGNDLKSSVQDKSKKQDGCEDDKKVTNHESADILRMKHEVKDTNVDSVIKQSSCKSDSQDEEVLSRNTECELEGFENRDVSRQRLNTDVSIVVSDTDDYLSEATNELSHLSGEETDATSQIIISSPGVHDNQNSLVFRYLSDTQGLSGEESVSENPKLDQKDSMQYVSISRMNSLENAQNSMDTQKSTSTMMAESGQPSLPWSPETEALHDVTLYIQGHSDTCLMLLLEKDSVHDENVLQAIFKSALPHMGELDYYVKDCMHQLDNDRFLDSYSFLRYDTFFQTMKGNSDIPVTSRDEEFQRLAAEMHTVFEEMPNTSEMIFKSHTGSCYGNRTINDETFFSAHTNSGIPTDRFPLTNDPVFSMDLTARQQLENVQNITLF